ncbi:hypothetical protein [Xanthomonas oryzae]|nr:hypothetical protein [Xanthomonas oryzae]
MTTPITARTSRLRRSKWPAARQHKFSPRDLQTSKSSDVTLLLTGCSFNVKRGHFRVLPCKMVVSLAPTINALTQAQRARLQMTETRERMRNGVHVAALPPGLVNLGDAARQRAGNASHAGSRKCSRHRRRQQHQHVLQYVVSIKQHVASARIAEGPGALRIVKQGCHNATGRAEARPVAVTDPLAAPGRAG